VKPEDYLYTPDRRTANFSDLLIINHYAHHFKKFGFFSFTEDFDKI